MPFVAALARRDFARICLRGRRNETGGRVLEIFDGHPALLVAVRFRAQIELRVRGRVVEGVPVDKLSAQACGAMGRTRGIGAGRAGLLFVAAADRCKRPDRPAQ